MNGKRETINVYVDKSSGGNPVFENLLVEPFDKNIYKLLASPGLALGIAKGDEIRFSRENGSYELLRRSGNLCLQVYPGVIGRKTPRS